MIAPLRHVVSLSHKSKITIISIAVVMMFITSIFIIVYSFEVSNRALAERFEAKYYIIASSENVMESHVDNESIQGAYVWITQGKVDENETYIVGIYDPHKILGPGYDSPPNGIILGSHYKYKRVVKLSISGKTYTLNTTRVYNFKFFPNYWVIVNHTLFTGTPNFIIVNHYLTVNGYHTYKMVTLSLFYSKTAEEVSVDLTIIDLISVVVIYLFINALLNIEVRDNIKKIAIIRAIGSSKFNIGAIYLLRSLFIGLLGMAIGFSLGVVLSYLLITLIPAMGMLTYFYVFVPTTVLYISLLVSITGSVLGSIAPIRKAVNTDIMRGLRGVQI